MKALCRSGSLSVLLSLPWLLACAGCFAAFAPTKPEVRNPASQVGLTETSRGAIIRGAADRKQLALVFTGHEYAEGATVILDTLRRQTSQASFFLTGRFLANTNFSAVVQRIVREGHYLGPHSEEHLLYCTWDSSRRTLVTRPQFASDLEANLERIRRLQNHGPEPRFFLPPYEHYNEEIAAWTHGAGLTLINYTPGTRSNADYTGEADRNFVSSQAIYKSILDREQNERHGLNGFILLLHLGAGPGRRDGFHLRFAELVQDLKVRGYDLVRIDEMLE